MLRRRTGINSSQNPYGDTIMVRPREFSYSEKEMIALGKEMIAYVKANKKTILHLCEWYTIEKGYTYNEWKNFIQKAEFFPYYEQALKIVGLKYVDKNSNVRDKISDRWQRIYFGDLREGEDKDADDNELRKAASLKGEVRAIEEEKLKILDEVQRKKRVLK
jgi:hypothetical protein